MTLYDNEVNKRLYSAKKDRAILEWNLRLQLTVPKALRAIRIAGSTSLSLAAVALAWPASRVDSGVAPPCR